MALLVIDTRACSEHPARIEQVAFAVVGAMSAEMARHGLGGDAAEYARVRDCGRGNFSAGSA